MNDAVRVKGKFTRFDWDDALRFDAQPELALARRLAEYPDVVRAVARHRAPSRLARYAQSVAGDFNQFYMDCRVLDEAEPELSVARLALVHAAKAILAGALRLAGVNAPERMDREPEPAA